MADIYLLNKVMREGPYSDVALRKLLDRGLVPGSQLAWHEGLPAWVPLAELLAVEPPLVPVMALPPSPLPTKPSRISRKTYVLLTVVGLIACGTAFLAVRERPWLASLSDRFAGNVKPSGLQITAQTNPVTNPTLPGNSKPTPKASVPIFPSPGSSVKLEVVDAADTPEEASLRAKAVGGDADAEYQIGMMYYEGKYANYDQPTGLQALAWLEKSAAKGNVDAQSRTGDIYLYKDGIVAKDYVRGLYWYRKAANQGNAHAQSNLGFFYFRGEGVTQDYEQAFRWSKMAAEQGNAPDEAHLGWMYYNGMGVTKDAQAAKEWWQKAAVQEEPRAKLALTGDYSAFEAVPW